MYFQFIWHLTRESHRLIVPNQREVTGNQGHSATCSHTHGGVRREPGSVSDHRPTTDRFRPMRQQDVGVAAEITITQQLPFDPRIHQTDPHYWYV